MFMQHMALVKQVFVNDITTILHAFCFEFLNIYNVVLVSKINFS